MKGVANLKRPLGLRVVAVACVGAWLACVSACLSPGLSCCPAPANEAPSYSHDCSAGADLEAQNANGHCDTAEGKSHPPDTGNSHERICCSAAKGIIQTSNPIFIPKDFAILFVLPDFQDALNPRLVGAVTSKVRHPISLEWVLTPEMRTGPAARSHAPPMFV